MFTRKRQTCHGKIIDMRTQACVHDVRVRLTDGLLQSSEEFGASTMN